MLKYVTDFGGFDRPHGPYEIDIRHWQEISRKPSSVTYFPIRTTTTEPLSLLPEVMSKVTTLGPAALQAVHRFLQEIELAALMEDIQDEAEHLRLEGKLDPELLNAAVLEHRERHPYR